MAALVVGYEQIHALVALPAVDAVDFAAQGDFPSIMQRQHHRGQPVLLAKHNFLADGAEAAVLRVMREHPRGAVHRSAVLLALQAQGRRFIQRTICPRGRQRQQHRIHQRVDFFVRQIRKIRLLQRKGGVPLHRGMVEIAHIRRVELVLAADDGLQAVVHKVPIRALREALQTADGHLVLREEPPRVVAGEENRRAVAVQRIQHGLTAAVPLRVEIQPAQDVCPLLRKRRVGVDSLPQVVRQCIQRHGGGERRDVVCQHAAGYHHMREQLRHVLQQPRRTKRRAVLPALRTGDGQKAPGKG